ncbi:MAG: 4Fe-4S binding protein [Magnetococcales bacterium]|nr:4Fe-4S binding protein [Magnetococcales bacterium]
MNSPFWNLGRLRRTVQILLLLLTVYGGLLVGPYLADKLSTAFPSLSCIYDQQNSAYCVLRPLQHQLNHRVGESIARLGEVTLEAFRPLLFTFLSFFAFFIVLNKAFCGWVCPLGTVQEMLYRLGRRLGLVAHALVPPRLYQLRAGKWLLLFLLVFLLPLLAGLGMIPGIAGDPYCQICPARLITTLLTASTEEMAVSTQGGLAFAFAAIRNLLFGFTLVAALTVRQPFCRICPMLALHAIFRRFSLLQLVKTPHDNCGHCSLCTRACPMDIPEISGKDPQRAFSEDCTLCGRCAEFCPNDQVISLRFGPMTLFASSKHYFSHRSRTEKPDGTPRLCTEREKPGNQPP